MHMVRGSKCCEGGRGLPGSCRGPGAGSEGACELSLGACAISLGTGGVSGGVCTVPRLWAEGCRRSGPEGVGSLAGSEPLKAR